MQLKQFTVGDIETKYQSECRHAQKKLFVMYQCRIDHDDIADKPVERRGYPKRFGDGTGNDGVTVYEAVDVTRLKRRMKKLLPQQIYGQKYADKGKIRDGKKQLMYSHPHSIPYLYLNLCMPLSVAIICRI